MGIREHMGNKTQDITQHKPDTFFLSFFFYTTTVQMLGDSTIIFIFSCKKLKLLFSKDA